MPDNPIIQQPAGWRFKIGDFVIKHKGAGWSGKVVGYYSTYLTSEGYAVESQQHRGSVQIYPAAALTQVHYDPDSY